MTDIQSTIAEIERAIRHSPDGSAHIAIPTAHRLIAHIREVEAERDALKRLKGKLAEIRQQNDVNIEHARAENGDAPLPHKFELLASHITDRLNEADAILSEQETSHD